MSVLPGKRPHIGLERADGNLSKVQRLRTVLGVRGRYTAGKVPDMQRLRPHALGGEVPPGGGRESRSSLADLSWRRVRRKPPDPVPLSTIQPNFFSWNRTCHQEMSFRSMLAGCAHAHLSADFWNGPDQSLRGKHLRGFCLALQGLSATMGPDIRSIAPQQRNKEQQS